MGDLSGDEPAISALMGSERPARRCPPVEVTSRDSRSTALIGVVLGVGDVQSGPVEIETLRVVECGLTCGPVFESSLAGAYDGGDRSEEVGP